MLGVGGKELSKLGSAVREFQSREDRLVDPKELRAIIDALEAEFSEVARRCQESGVHHASDGVEFLGYRVRIWGKRTGGRQAQRITLAGRRITARTKSQDTGELQLLFCADPDGTRVELMRQRSQ